jgi:hypothetical protein
MPFLNQISTLKLHYFDFLPVFPVFKLVLLTFESFPTLLSTELFSVFGFLTDFSDVFDFFFDPTSFSSLSKLTSASLFLVLMPPLVCIPSLFSDFLDDFDYFNDFSLSLFTFSVDASTSDFFCDFFVDFDPFALDSSSFFESLLLLADLDLLEELDLFSYFDLELAELLAALFPAYLDFLGRSVFPFLT